MMQARDLSGAPVSEAEARAHIPDVVHEVSHTADALPVVPVPHMLVSMPISCC
jgi:hypothetical protein